MSRSCDPHYWFFRGAFFFFGRLSQCRSGDPSLPVNTSGDFQTKLHQKNRHTVVDIPIGCSGAQQPSAPRWMYRTMQTLVRKLVGSWSHERGSLWLVGWVVGSLVCSPRSFAVGTQARIRSTSPPCTHDLARTSPSFAFQSWSPCQGVTTGGVMCLARSRQPHVLARRTLSMPPQRCLTVADARFDELCSASYHLNRASKLRSARGASHRVAYRLRRVSWLRVCTD
jgi:hypothetical protein